MALGQGVRELQWMHSLLAELQLRSPQVEAPSDDEAVVQLQETHRQQHITSHTQSQVTVSPPPSTLLTDNQSTEALVQQRGAMGARSKHIDVRHHHIREVVLSGAVRVQWVPTAEQLADAFTKSLPPAAFHRLRGRIMGEGAVEVQVEARVSQATAQC